MIHLYQKVQREPGARAENFHLGHSERLPRGRGSEILAEQDFERRKQEWKELIS